MKQPRSGGPKTEAGKEKCARNAIKHGATSSKMFVLANENAESWNGLLAAAVSDYKPLTEIEHKYVEAIAFALWRLRRIWAVQTCAINLKMDDQAADYAATFVHEDETVRHTLALQALTAEDQELARLTRYEASLQRAHDRAVLNLRNVREMRSAESGTPEITKQTAQPKTSEPPVQAEWDAAETCAGLAVLLHIRKVESTTAIVDSNAEPAPSLPNTPPPEPQPR